MSPTATSTVVSSTCLPVSVFATPVTPGRGINHLAGPSLRGVSETEPTHERERRRAFDLAGRALSSRDRTVAELRSHLERKRVEPELIEVVVEELRGSGLLDDASFAQRFAEDKQTLERWGRERIERDLARRGVPGPLIEAALVDRDSSRELEEALRLLEERVPEAPAGDRERDRVWRMLVRRGYSPELAYDAVRAHARRRAA